jgi:lipoprotein-anchoring transpeptidase ErfK/SrfK
MKQLRGALTGWLAGALILAGASLLLPLRLGDYGPHSVGSEAAPRLWVRFSGLPLAANLTVDGRPLPLRTDWGQGLLEAQAPPLEEGSHQVVVRAGSWLSLGQAELSWRLHVDRTPPSLALLPPPPLVGQAQVDLEGRTEPGTVVQVAASQGSQAVAVNAQGGFRARVPLRHGSNSIVWTASDTAGNRVSQRQEVLCDLKPPEVRLLEPPGQTLDSSTLRVRAALRDGLSGLARVRLVVDGRLRDEQELAGAEARVTLAASGLPEGTRQVTVEAQDRAGNLFRSQRSLLMDSSETFGEAVLTEGARGDDVRELQRRLVHRGLLRPEQISRVYDASTRQAVAAFQARRGLAPDGRCGRATLAELSPTLWINLAAFELVLEREGRERARYPIAHGTAQHPTPSGEFRIVVLERNPTWYPPDSIWAREARITPPGPGNPLGTRWIGLDSGVVGIHGTPAEETVGTRASHGCIRMRISDVEALYEQVNVGCRVVILQGHEREARRYW